MTDRSVDAWLDHVEDYWSRHGMTSRVRRRLVTELQADLEDAIDGGATVDELVARDVPVFAREVAEAEGIELAPDDRPAVPTREDLSRTTVGGAVIGAALAWAWFTSPMLVVPAGPEWVGLALLYLVALALVIGGAVALVRWRYRWWDGANRAALIGGAAALAGIAASIGPIVALAALLGYSTALLSMLLLAAAGAGICFVVSRVLFRRLSPYAPI